MRIREAQAGSMEKTELDRAIRRWSLAVSSPVAPIDAAGIAKRAVKEALAEQREGRKLKERKNA